MYLPFNPMLTLALLLLGAAFAVDFMQARYDMRLLPRPFLFVLLVGGYTSTALGAFWWIFAVKDTTSMFLKVPLGGAGVAFCFYAIFKVRDEFPKSKRPAPAEEGARSTAEAPDGEGETVVMGPLDGADGEAAAPAPAFVVGDDPHPTEKTARVQGGSL